MNAQNETLYDMPPGHHKPAPTPLVPAEDPDPAPTIPDSPMGE